jgi:hypothetical protein
VGSDLANCFYNLAIREHELSLLASSLHNREAKSLSLRQTLPFLAADSARNDGMRIWIGWVMCTLSRSRRDEVGETNFAS